MLNSFATIERLNQADPVALWHSSTFIAELSSAAVFNNEIVSDDKGETESLALASMAARPEFQFCTGRQMEYQISLRCSRNAFMVLESVTGGLKTVSGPAKHPEEFETV